MVDRWDFWKPVGWKSMGPLMDGAGSMELYFECLRKCLDVHKARTGKASVLDEHEHVVMHLGSGPKFVRKAFHELVRHEKGEVGEMAEGLLRRRRRRACMWRRVWDRCTRRRCM